jgi:hypothetical protein
LDQQDWKTTVPAARHQVAGHFLRTLRLIEAGMLEQAETCLSARRWRKDIDLTGVPGEVLHKTEVLASRALTLAQHGDPDALAEMVTRIVDVWS